MADVKEKHVIDLNRLNFGGSGRPQGMYFQGEVNQAYFGSTKVYNRALYHMEAPWDDYFSTDARSFDLKNMLMNFNFSWKKDLAGENKDVQEAVEWYMDDPNQEVLPGNEDENNAKDTEFTLTQYLSGLQVTGWVRQAKDHELSTEYKNVEVTSVRYSMDAPAAGFDNIPLLVSFSGYKVPVWASGKEATAVPFGGTLRSGFLSLSGRALSDDVSFDSTTGEVDAPYLADTPMDERDIAVVTYVKISTDAGELEWTGAAYLKQAANVKFNDGDPTYDIYSFPSTYEVSGEATYIYIHIRRAYKTQAIKWTSGYEDSETEDTYVKLSTSVGDLDDSILYGANYTILDIPQNGTTERYITVRVWNNDAGYDVTHTITQAAYEEKEVWQAPFISGSVSVGEIAADGSGALLNATIIQYKKKGDTITQTYYPSITSLVGTAVSGTGFSYSNGVVYASSMGTTEYKSGRKVYTITGFKVSGGDGNTYTLPLSSSLEVWQEANTYDFQGYGDYILSLSANPQSGIDTLGGTSTITASAQIEKIYEWTSGDGRNTELSPSYANLKTNAGTIGPTSITGVNQKATLTLEENELNEVKEVTVTLYVSTLASTSIPVYQNRPNFSFTRVDAQNISIEGTTGTVTIRVNSTRNGNALAITASDVSLSGISGATVDSVVASSYPVGQYNIIINVGQNGSTARTLNVVVTQPTTNSTLSFTVTQAATSVSYPVDQVWKFSNGNVCESNGWYLGQVLTGGVTGSPYYRQLYHIIAVTTAANKDKDALIRANFSYTYNPAGTSLPGDFNNSVEYSAGSTVTINGTSYYGVILVSGLPAVAQNSISSFNVTLGGA